VQSQSVPEFVSGAILSVAEFELGAIAIGFVFFTLCEFVSL